ncbi:MAG: hypothetical protein OEU09_00220 [Rhodospirillales bacterium]|nr:hypothetical protein [Rhodospirillales bacterium]MDH3909686.1 hypothetical protein [Rhodospirillales bacterium]MDH3919112.1 hypothetical protein [Rhodospirillales bacterium]
MPRTPDTALGLARLFGTTPQFWINLQAAHDLWKAKVESAAAIERAIKPVHADAAWAPPAPTGELPLTRDRTA